jgi:hypothetical protein
VTAQARHFGVLSKNAKEMTSGYSEEIWGPWSHHKRVCKPKAFSGWLESAAQSLVFYRKTITAGEHSKRQGLLSAYALAASGKMRLEAGSDRSNLWFLWGDAFGLRYMKETSTLSGRFDPPCSGDRG